MSGFNMQPSTKPGQPVEIDLVCGMKVDAEKPPYKWTYQGKTYCFCSEVCRHLFQHDPQKYIPVQENAA